MVEVLAEPALEADAPARARSDVAVDVRFADDDVIVVAKPAGLVVHPGAGHATGTLVNGLLARFPEHRRRSAIRCGPGIVHRLDRDTSGLLVVARSARAYDSLVAQLAARSVERVYAALVWGRLVVAARDDRRADRSFRRAPHADGRARRGQGGAHRVRGRRDVRRARSAACSSARSRPAARIRSACTSPRSVIPSSATAPTAARATQIPLGAPVPARGDARLRPSRHRRAAALRRRRCPPSSRAVLDDGSTRASGSTEPDVSARASGHRVGVADAGALDELGERDALEDAARLVVDADPDLLQDAVPLAVVGVLGQHDLRAFDRGDDVGERDLARWRGRARSRRRRRASSARARRPSPTAGSARGTAAAGACARRSPSPRSGGRCRAARATAAPGRRSRRASTSSCPHRRADGQLVASSRPGSTLRPDDLLPRRRGPARARRCVRRRPRPGPARRPGRLVAAGPGPDGRGGRAVGARRPRAGTRCASTRPRCPSSRRWTAARSPPSCPRRPPSALDLDRDRARAGPARDPRLPHARRRRRAERAALVGAGQRPPARPVRRAAPHRVPRPAGPGRDQVGVPRRPASPQAHLRGGRFVGWHTTAALVEHCVARSRRASDSSTRTTRVSTRSRTSSGCTTRVWRRELAAADALVGALLDALPERAALLVTADHGQVHLEPESWIAIPDLAPMTTAMAGDGRFRYLYARKGAARELLAAARDQVGDAAWVWSRAEVLDEGLLGDGRDRQRARPHRRRRARGARRGRVRRSGAAERGAAALGPRLAHRRRDARPPRRRGRPRPGLSLTPARSEPWRDPVRVA